jgi:two-component system, LuxR family, response regulator FixJ
VCDSRRFLLEAYNFGVRTYQSGADFFADAPDIACLIVDYQMPGENGFELVSELRKLSSNVPAIMIFTGEPIRASQRITCSKAGSNT